MPERLRDQRDAKMSEQEKNELRIIAKEAGKAISRVNDELWQIHIEKQMSSEKENSEAES